MTGQARLSFQLPAFPDSVPLSRRLLNSFTGWTTSEVQVRAELILSELVTNAIRHGSRRADDVINIDLTVEGAAIFASVLDSGEPFAVPEFSPSADQIGGFGLHIVEQLASTWKIERRDDGNCVSFAVTGT